MHSYRESVTHVFYEKPAIFLKMRWRLPLPRAKTSESALFSTIDHRYAPVLTTKSDDMRGHILFDNISTLIAHVSTSNGACKGNILNRYSLIYVVRRRSTTKSSCIVGSLGAERMSAIKRLGLVNSTKFYI